MCLLPSSHISQCLHSQGAHVYIFISGSKSSFAACSYKGIFFVLLCIVSFVTESFESFSLRFVSFSPKSQGFWTLQESGLESCYMSGCQKCSGGAATNSSVSHCFSVFGCALWQPSLGALTPEF